MLTRSGTDVTGTYKGQLGEAPVKGTLKGDAMKGKVSYGDMAEGTFTGKKG